MIAHPPTALAAALASVVLSACQPGDPQHADATHGGAIPVQAAQAGPAADARARTGVQAVGALQIASPWIRATPPMAKTAGGFFTIRNTGKQADRLLSLKTDAAKEVQVHDMSMANGVMRMRHLPDGLEIPAGGRVELRPGGYHLMLIAPPKPLVAGATVQMRLTFEHAGTVDVAFPVRPITATSAGDEHAGH